MALKFDKGGGYGGRLSGLLRVSGKVVLLFVKGERYGGSQVTYMVTGTVVIRLLIW